MVESWASFSLRLGCGLVAGCGELNRLFFGIVGLMSAFIDSAIRFDFASALSTLTFTICPALTASEGIFNETIREFADMYKPVLVNANVDEMRRTW